MVGAGESGGCGDGGGDVCGVGEVEEGASFAFGESEEVGLWEGRAPEGWTGRGMMRYSGGAGSRAEWIGWNTCDAFEGLLYMTA